MLVYRRRGGDLLLCRRRRYIARARLSLDYREEGGVRNRLADCKSFVPVPGSI